MDVSENLENEFSSVVCPDISAASSAPGWGSPLQCNNNNNNNTNDTSGVGANKKSTPATRGRLADLSAFLNGEVANSITAKGGHRIGIARVSPFSTVIGGENDGASTVIPNEAASERGRLDRTGQTSARGTVVMGLTARSSNEPTDGAMLARDVGMLLSRVDDLEDQLDTCTESLGVLRRERDQVEEQCASVERRCAALEVALEDMAADAEAREEAFALREAELLAGAEKRSAEDAQRIAALEEIVKAVQERLDDKGAQARDSASQRDEDASDRVTPYERMGWFRRFLARRRERKAAAAIKEATTAPTKTAM